MPRESRTFVEGDTPLTDLTPRRLTKTEFGRRVYNRMLELSLHQAELARAAGLPRDSISNYVNGRSLPTPANLEKLAKALRVDKDKLLPNMAEAALQNDTNGFELRMSAADPKKSWLRIDRLVSTTTAIKIAGLLNDDVAD